MADTAQYRHEVFYRAVFSAPMRMPADSLGCNRSLLRPSDSESATYSTSFLSMKIPLGRPNCFHSAIKRPSWSKIWMRLFWRSPRKGVLWSRTPKYVGNRIRRFPFLSSPGLDELSVLIEFHDAGVGGGARPWPSVGRCLRWSDGNLGRLINVSVPGPATPALPSTSKSLPSG